MKYIQRGQMVPLSTCRLSHVIPFMRTLAHMVGGGKTRATLKMVLFFALVGFFHVTHICWETVCRRNT